MGDGAIQYSAQLQVSISIYLERTFLKQTICQVNLHAPAKAKRRTKQIVCLLQILGRYFV